MGIIKALDRIVAPVKAHPSLGWGVAVFVGASGYLFSSWIPQLTARRTLENEIREVVTADSVDYAQIDGIDEAALHVTDAFLPWVHAIHAIVVRYQNVSIPDSVHSRLDSLLQSAKIAGSQAIGALEATPTADPALEEARRSLLKGQSEYARELSVMDSLIWVVNASRRHAPELLATVNGFDVWSGEVEARDSAAVEAWGAAVTLHGNAARRRLADLRAESSRARLQGWLFAAALLYVLVFPYFLFFYSLKTPPQDPTR